MLNCPSAYVNSYEQAKSFDSELAENYIRHTTIGDPELDPVMDELSTLPTNELHRYIRAGIEQDDEETYRRAPQILKDFFENFEVPEWVDYEAFIPGQRAFHRYMRNVLVGYAVGSAVEGFSTLVAQSFCITGRVPNLGPGAVRRLKQNNRHMIETYFPEGLKRDRDGWKITMRIRFVHARIRKLLADSENWEPDKWGTPLSAAHFGGISLFTFSVRKFEHAIALGSKITNEEMDSIAAIWRYAGHILGIPKEILYTDKESARRLFKVARMCEPSPSESSISMANSVFKALPEVAGLKSEKEKKKLVVYAYRISRSLIGKQLANELQFPKYSTIGALQFYQFKEQIDHMFGGKLTFKIDSFSQFFDAAQYDKEGISYRLPDHVFAKNQSAW